MIPNLPRKWDVQAQRQTLADEVGALSPGGPDTCSSVLRCWKGRGNFPPSPTCCTPKHGAHILEVRFAQLLEDRQVELEEEAEGKGPSELHHTTRGVGGQVQLLCQASTHILQQLLIPSPGRGQSVGLLPPTHLHHSVWGIASVE